MKAVGILSMGTGLLFLRKRTLKLRLISLAIFPALLTLFVAFSQCYKFPIFSSPGEEIQSGNRTVEIAKDGTTFQPLSPKIEWWKRRWDNRRIVQIYEWVWTGSSWGRLSDELHVCLATQGSVDRIASVAQTAQHWTGPISLAVYVRSPGEMSVLVSFVVYMKRCSPEFHQRMSIHLGIPFHVKLSSLFDVDGNESAWLERVPQWIPEFPCGQPLELVAHLAEQGMLDGVEPFALYPQNHMRNVARKTCSTPWVFTADIDIIPRPGAAEILEDLYNSTPSNCSCAFVVPVYELSRAAGKFPETKPELLELAAAGLAYPYQWNIDRRQQYATDYEKWSSTNLEETLLKVSHEVNTTAAELVYEPFYISSDQVPAHDERFIGYGADRIAQVYETRRKGWSFKVLTPIFAIHWGLKGNTSLLEKHAVKASVGELLADFGFHRFPPKGPGSRRAQSRYNWESFMDLVKELDAKEKILIERRNSSKIGWINVMP